MRRIHQGVLQPLQFPKLRIVINIIFIFVNSFWILIKVIIYDGHLISSGKNILSYFRSFFCLASSNAFYVFLTSFFEKDLVILLVVVLILVIRITLELAIGTVVSAKASNSPVGVAATAQRHISHFHRFCNLVVLWSVAGFVVSQVVGLLWAGGHLLLLVVRVYVHRSLFFCLLEGSSSGGNRASELPLILTLPYVRSDVLACMGRRIIRIRLIPRRNLTLILLRLR